MDALTFAEQAAPLHRRLTQVTYLICGDRELAEESAQEALVRAWKRVDDAGRLLVATSRCPRTSELRYSHSPNGSGR